MRERITGIWRKKDAPDQVYITYRDGDETRLTNGVYSWAAIGERMNQLEYMGWRDNRVDALRKIASYIESGTDYDTLGLIHDELKEAFELKDREIKTQEDWHRFAVLTGISNWDEYCTKGDFVDDEFVDYFMDCVPPISMSSKCSQVGEPASTRVDDEGNWHDTYTTFKRVGKNKWLYCGDCFVGETEERGREPYYV